MGTFFKLPGGVFFHVGEPFTLSVKRGGANVEGRGHPLVGRGLGERECQFRIKQGVDTGTLELRTNYSFIN